MLEPRKAEIFLEYQPYIDNPPVPHSHLRAQSTSNDEVTVTSWKPTWLKNVKENLEKYGAFNKNSIAEIFRKFEHKPCIVAGSGPSLKENAKELRDKADVPMISCLHNFHFFHDNDIKPDFYVTLDAGEVTVEEVYEGGSKTPDEYWAATKDHTLLCYIATSPRLLAKWQGRILFFNCPVPDLDYMDQITAMDPFYQWVSTGGNVLGASLYIAKAFLGCNITALIGADFSFSYKNNFHGWDSKYDKNLGHYMKVTDVFGVKVKTWQSYYNFKSWFDWVACMVPGIYINCSEGGCFGAYPEGNIRQIMQVPLKEFLKMINLHGHMRSQVEDPSENKKTILF